jgi:hypothetical protein
LGRTSPSRRKPEAGSRKPEAGSRKPEAGSRKPEAGSYYIGAIPFVKYLTSNFAVFSRFSLKIFPEIRFFSFFFCLRFFFSIFSLFAISQKSGFSLFFGKNGFYIFRLISEGPESERSFYAQKTMGFRRMGRNFCGGPSWRMRFQRRKRSNQQWPNQQWPIREQSNRIREFRKLFFNRTRGTAHRK